MSEQKFLIEGGFFNSVDGDRRYNAEKMNKPYKRIISEGIFATQNGTPSTDFQVLSAKDGMNIIVKAGDGLLGEKWIENISDIAIGVSANTSIMTRIDSIIIQVDKTQRGRVANVIYREGIASSNPKPPLINGVENIIEMRVANIQIAPNTDYIGQELITDLRGSRECPWITSLVKQVDTSTLFLQWQEAYQKYYDESTEGFETWFNDFSELSEADFDNWFNNIKDKLNEDIAGSLQSQIDELVMKCEKISLEIADWAENEITGYYEYNIVNQGVSANHLIEGYMDLENQAKMVDGYIESYNGGYKIVTSELPKGVITMNVSIQKAIVEEVTE